MHNWNTRRRRKIGTEEIFKVIMIVNFPKLITDTKQHIWESQGTPSRVNTTKITPRYIILKLKKKSKKRGNLEKRPEKKATLSGK